MKFINLNGLNGNAYSSSRYLYEDIKVKKDKIIYSSKRINEEIDYNFPNDKLGGIITLSTDVNAKKLSNNVVINWFKQKIRTINNRLTYSKKVNKIVGDQYKEPAWTVGKFLSGRYKSKDGHLFDENSISIEIVGITSEELVNIATDLCLDFDQESVLVKDYTTKDIYLVNDEK